MAILGIGFILLGIGGIFYSKWNWGGLKIKIAVTSIILGAVFLKVDFASHTCQNELANETVKKKENEHEKLITKEFESNPKEIEASKNEPVNGLVKEVLYLSENELKILRLLEKNASITQEEIAGILHLSKSSVKRNMTKLREKEWIARVGSDKKGYWKILK